MNRIGGIMVRLCAWSVVDRGVAGVDPAGRTRRAPPPKIGKDTIFWRKIVIFHTKYPKFFAPPSARRNFFKSPPP